MSVIGHGVEIVANAAARPVGPAEGTLIYQQDTNQLLLWDNSDWQSVFPAPPTGSIQAYAGTTEPIGWLFCSGQPISRTIYSSLFDVIGTTYGVGDGATTFNLPDLRGRAPAGRDNMGGSAANRLTSGVSGLSGAVLGAVGGNERLQGHTHTFSGNTSSNPVTPFLRMVQPTGTSLSFNHMVGLSFSPPFTDFVNAAFPQHYHSFSGTTNNHNLSQGSSANVQPTMILNYLIKL